VLIDNKDLAEGKGLLFIWSNMRISFQDKKQGRRVRKWNGGKRQGPTNLRKGVGRTRAGNIAG